MATYSFDSRFRLQTQIKRVQDQVKASSCKCLRCNSLKLELSTCESAGAAWSCEGLAGRALASVLFFCEPSPSTMA